MRGGAVVGLQHFDPLTPGVSVGDLDPGGFATLEVGRVKRVSAKGVSVELPSSPKYLYGPAPWSLGAADNAAAAIADGLAPRPGDRCLIGFAGDDHVPWVLAWWR